MERMWSECQPDLGLNLFDQNYAFGWHHRLDGHEFEQVPGLGGGQEGLALLQCMGSQRAE